MADLAELASEWLEVQERLNAPPKGALCRNGVSRSCPKWRILSTSSLRSTRWKVWTLLR